MLVWGWLVVLFGWLFILGSAVGSFLNVCIYRLPRRRNLFWPSSRCGSCFSPIRMYDNLPLLAYWLLGGRCRTCGTRFSIRYFLVELIVGVVFAGLYALEIGENLHGFDAWSHGGFYFLEAGQFPPHSWTFFLGHAVLASTLVVALGCLLDGEEVPRGMIVFGALCGLIWALLYPWPTPNHPTAGILRPGFVASPVWIPLPGWLESGSFESGFLGALAGILLPARFLHILDHRRQYRSAAGLLMITGGFLGWQPLLVALALSTLFMVAVMTRQRMTGNFFALTLGCCLILVWFGWSWLGPWMQPVLFDAKYLLLSLAILTGTLVICNRRLPQPN